VLELLDRTATNCSAHLHRGLGEDISKSLPGNDRLATNELAQIAAQLPNQPICGVAERWPMQRLPYQDGIKNPTVLLSRGAAPSAMGSRRAERRAFASSGVLYAVLIFEVLDCEDHNAYFA
jgi:hypothetical protein